MPWPKLQWRWWVAALERRESSVSSNTDSTLALVAQTLNEWNWNRSRESQPGGQNIEYLVCMSEATTGEESQKMSRYASRWPFITAQKKKKNNGFPTRGIRLASQCENFASTPDERTYNYTILLHTTPRAKKFAKYLNEIRGLNHTVSKSDNLRWWW